jgi:trehalose 6-phosphate synthase/phosphatase
MLKEVVENYKNATNRLILLDYDGTLVEFKSLPDNATAPDHLESVLIKLIKKPQTKVVIISGRAYHDINKFLGHLPIDIIAEHGAIIKRKGKWSQQVIDPVLWKSEIIPFLNEANLACPASFIEVKDFSLVWHFRNVELVSGYKHSRKLIRNLERIIPSFNLKILDGNKVVEIMTQQIGKGKAVRSIVENSNYDFILSIGDDKTDEEIFEFLAPYAFAFTIKVGKGKTNAKYKVKNVNMVISLLEQFVI